MGSSNTLCACACLSQEDTDNEMGAIQYVHLSGPPFENNANNKIPFPDVFVSQVEMKLLTAMRSMF